jgi:glycosyltransferase involved in cell wall biosynthesis
MFREPSLNVSEPSVNIAVCGKFHILNYVEHLSKKGVLNKLYCSTKRSNIKKLTVNKEIIKNFSTKEYLLYLHNFIFKANHLSNMIPYYHSIWNRSVIRNWNPANTFHFISHGACLPLIKQARADGATVICELVNTHPQSRFELLRSEEEKWGIKNLKKDLNLSEYYQIEEALQSDYLLSPSNHVSNSYIINGFKIPIHKIPYAGNTKKFKAIETKKHLKNPLDNIKIICVGNISLRKGQLYLLEAIKSLKSNNIHLTLVGKIQNELLPLIKKYSPNFNHINHINNDDLPKLLATQDIFVLASLEEGLAIAITEAMSMGLPIITTFESGASDIIEHGLNGIIVPSRSTQHLAEEITNLINNPDLRYSLGKNALKSIQKTYNWQSYSDALVNFYYKTLKK